ncbi:hypothetical protein [Pteropox virus]|uniref:Uncharacterized protein n=1 Tax=Pteropox virus TaxID=1873698 RepID=A0A1B1MR87_9POXV|nr:hypothetical protein [Pteropox virus]ANS71096.1 hypothetical protein [Pteropox virus]
MFMSKIIIGANTLVFLISLKCFVYAAPVSTSTAAEDESPTERLKSILFIVFIIVCGLLAFIACSACGIIHQMIYQVTCCCRTLVSSICKKKNNYSLLKQKYEVPIDSTFTVG